jgi:hypothetical protein
MGLVTETQTWSTPDALKIAGIDPVRWSNAVARAGLPAPATVPGRVRSFTVDDIIVLQVFQGFLDIGATPQWAAKIAYLVDTALKRDPKAKSIAICKEVRANGQPEMVVYEKPPAHADVVFPMDLERYRRVIGRSLRGSTAGTSRGRAD